MPSGGGLRSCVGKELVKILLEMFTGQLARHCGWRFLNGPPVMKTDPILYPVDNFPARFTLPPGGNQAPMNAQALDLFEVYL